MDTHIQVCKSIHTERFIPLEPKEARTRTPLVPSTGARAGAEREKLMCLQFGIHAQFLVLISPDISL